jgi:preprotein translocase subunit SecF
LDLAVALAIGMAVGTYSSIFIATPFLVDLKNRQPDIKSLSVRVHARRAGQARATRETVNPAGPQEATASVATLEESTIIEGPRSQPKRVPRSKRGKS